MTTQVTITRFPELNNFFPRRGDLSSDEKIALFSTKIFEQYVFWNKLSLYSAYFFISACTARIFSIQIPSLIIVTSLFLTVFGLNRGATTYISTFLHYLNLKGTAPNLCLFLKIVFESERVSNLSFDIRANSLSFQIVPNENRAVNLLQKSCRAQVTRNQGALTIQFFSNQEPQLVQGNGHPETTFLFYKLTYNFSTKRLHLELSINGENRDFECPESEILTRFNGLLKVNQGR